MKRKDSIADSIARELKVTRLCDLKSGQIVALFESLGTFCFLGPQRRVVF